MAVCDGNIIPFKRGDDLFLDMTVKNKNSQAALDALAILEASQAQLVIDQALLQEAIDAIPYVQQDVDDAQAVVDATVAQIVLDQADYDLAIIVDITAWTITSDLVWCDEIQDTLVVVIVDALLGQFRIQRDAILTAAWQKRLFEVCTRFDIPTLGKRSAETFYLDLRKS
jgi:hypothetical protein